MTSVTSLSVRNNPEEIDLLQIVGEIIDHWKTVVVCTSVFTLCALCYVLTATPVYQASALIQVEQKTGNVLFSGLKQVLGDSQTPSAPEIALLNSRMILGETVDALGLQVRVTPVQLLPPGSSLARLTGSVEGKIAVSYFSLPAGHRAADDVVLTVRDRTHYRITTREMTQDGITGQRLESEGLSILVSRIEAPPGSRFVLTTRTRLEAITDLQRHFQVSEQGKDTGMINLTLTGQDPALTARILENISQNYQRQNAGRQAEQDEKSLSFLNRQMPLIREQLDRAEDTLSTYRQQKDSIDLSLEARSVLEQIVNVDNQLNELTFREAEISQRYRKEHPVYRALLEKRENLKAEKEKLNGRVSTMPATQQTVLSLSRDVESGRQVYQQLLNRQQELRIARAGVTGNVRIIDEAVTFPVPVTPRKALIIILGMLAGVMISVAGILVRSALHRGIETSDMLEDAGIMVFASIPLSTENGKRHVHKGGLLQPGILATLSPADPAVEAIRSLRTSLHFAMMDTGNNVLMISGASPGAGKSFISSNLAQVVAGAGKKVLLIDGDLRKGYLHDVLGVSSITGLSDILSGRMEPDQVLVSLPVEGFDYIGRGQIPPNPAELLMHPRLEALLERVSPRYDLVILDTPPILAVTDAAIMGQHAGTVMLVARVGSDTVKDMVISMKRFEQSGMNVKGCILNGVVRKAGDYYRYADVPTDYTTGGEKS